MYILRRLSVFFSSWANIDILHVDSRLLWIETWFIQPLGLVIPCSGFPVLQQPGRGGCADATLTVDLAAAQTRRAAVLAIIHHHHHHAQKRSSSQLTLPVKVSWTQTRLLSNSTFSDSRPHSQFSEARVFQARTLRSTCVRVTLRPPETRQGENISLFKTHWCKSDAGCSNARTAPMHKKRRAALRWVAFGFSGAVGQNELILQ